jgi:hypothetical protein
MMLWRKRSELSWSYVEEEESRTDKEDIDERTPDAPDNVPP